MDKTAKKILHKIKPILEMMCEDDYRVNERELDVACKMVGIAKRLIECDVMLAKLAELRDDDETPEDGNPKPHKRPMY